MTYKINGVEFTLQPSSGRWMPRDVLGYNGFGHPVYPAVREFEIRWVIKTPAEVNQIYGWYNSISNTGTVVVDLPQFAAASYAFFSYTGCILVEPDQGTYFTEHIQDVVMIVSNVRV